MIGRREFVALLTTAGLAAAAPVAPAPPAPPKRFGVVTVDSWLLHYNRTGKRLRVLHDGVDVTRRCTYADDVRGVAICFKHRDGKPYIDLDGRRIAREALHGIRIVEE